MYHDDKKVQDCRDTAPKFSGQVELHCSDGEMAVSEGKCFRDCEGFSILFGSVFSHGTMAHNEVKEMECPSSGELFCSATLLLL